MKTFKLALVLLVLSLSFIPLAKAQAWDNSGNGLLKGTYYFRNVIWSVGYQDGSLDDYIAIYGNITFDGAGNFSISNAQAFEAANNAVQRFGSNGTYSISASGYGFLSSPVFNGVDVHGLVSRGIFVASSTEGGFNDLFIAAEANASGSSNAAFRGSYSLAQIDFPTGAPADTRNSRFALNPDGSGNIGTVQATGYIAGRGSAAVSQTLTGVRYSVSNGAAVVFMGGTLNSTNLIAGTKYLYLSADGDFVFGGSPNGGDMIVGVRSGGTAPLFSGLYYEAGVFQDESQLLSAGVGDLNTYYGSLRASNGTILGHERLLSPFQDNPIDYTYSGTVTLGSDNSYDRGSDHFIFGPSGIVRIGSGNGAAPGISVAVQVPNFTSSGVFIDPTGVVNAASSSLFTSGIAPGELITIYGSNLSARTVADATFPTTLGGVQVMINNRPSPIYVVSPTQISAVVPYGTTEQIASLQVINNGSPSNSVTAYVNTTTPGIFTLTPGGIGSAAALHADNSVVTAANPAKAGEAIAVYVTGLGTVNPAVADGAPTPTTSLSATTSPISVLVDHKTAAVAFAGLAPGLVGLYQINFTVPSNVSSGDVALEILGPNAFTSQATLPTGSGAQTTLALAARPRIGQPGRLLKPQRRALKLTLH